MVFKSPLLEDVVTKENEENSPDHQTPQQETTFQNVLRDLCTDAEFQDKVLNHNDYRMLPAMNIFIGHDWSK